MSEKLNFKLQQDNNDRLLDELNYHLGQAEVIKAELAESLIDKSDSENRIEQQHNQSLLSKSFDNPLMAKLKKEENTILRIKSEILAKTSE